MSYKPNIAPHLEKNHEEESFEVIHEKKSKFSLQWPSKYGPGGRRAFGAKGRKSDNPKSDNKRWK